MRTSRRGSLGPRGSSSLRWWGRLAPCPAFLHPMILLAACGVLHTPSEDGDVEAEPSVDAGPDVGVDADPPLDADRESDADPDAELEADVDPDSGSPTWLVRLGDEWAYSTGVAAAVALPNGDLLVGGHHGGAAWVARLDGLGRPLWSRYSDGGPGEAGALGMGTSDTSFAAS